MLNWLKKKLSPSDIPDNRVASQAARGAPPIQDLSAESKALLRTGNVLLDEGKLEEAERCYRQVLELVPGHLNALVNLGFVLREQGRYEDAEAFLLRAVAADISSVDARYILGTVSREMGISHEAIEHFAKVLDMQPGFEPAYDDLCRLLVDTGQHARAEELMDKALGFHPRSSPFHFYRANLLAMRNQFDAAIEEYRQALSVDSDNVGAWRGLGETFMKLRRPVDAAASFRHTIALAPDDADGYNNLGRALDQSGTLDEASDAYRKALELDPSLHETHNNVANVYKQQGRIADAVACYRKALELRPDLAEVHYNLGTLYREQARLDEARQCFSVAVALKADLPEAHNSLGTVHLDQGRLSEAAASYEKALAIKPDFADAHNNLGNIFKIRGQLDKALACYRAALRSNPEHPLARIHLVHVLQHLCEWDDLAAHVDVVRHAITDATPNDRLGVPPFAFLALPGTTAAEQRICADMWAQEVYGPLKRLREELAFDFRCDDSPRIRIGYLSADFHTHATALLMARVFELHDRERFEIHAYSYGPDDKSSMRKRLEKAFDDFVDIRHSSLEDAARKIHADRIDILVDLKGHTQDTRSSILALRPAPILLNYLGYPGTLGGKLADYILADEFIIPVGQEHHYSEEVVRIADCYQPNDRSRARPVAPSRHDCGLPESGIVFCCFNQTYKISPDIFDQWCRLLTAVPGSILWLLASNPFAEENLRREANKRGVSGDCLVMAPKVTPEEHLARLQCADIFLDTLPYNAHTTCSDALWMGLPVVTCPGETFPSRVAGSLLHAIGLPELIAASMDDYYAIALRLATDNDARGAYRNRIMENRASAPLFDSERFTRNLEDAYSGMYRRHRVTMGA